MRYEKAPCLFHKEVDKMLNEIRYGLFYPDYIIPTRYVRTGYL